MRKLVVVSFVLAILSIASLISGCAGEDPIHSSGHTQLFVQDFNPKYLDILWVLDDRSPMNDAKAHISAEAKKFFLKLDEFTGSYRMGVVSGDGTGRLIGGGDAGLILEKNIGTPESRAAIIETRISKIINLNTKPEVYGMKSAKTALNGQFPSRPGVPLVIVFISDSYDENGATADLASSHFNEMLVMKGGNKDLLKVYSITYIAATDPANPPKEIRCCNSQYEADIDKKPGIQNPFDELAALTSGQSANLCAGFADQISLHGLMLKELQTVFLLESRPEIPSSISVVMTQNKGQEIPTTPWLYDEVRNAIVFTELPPEGATIQVTYR